MAKKKVKDEDVTALMSTETNDDTQSRLSSLEAITAEHSKAIAEIQNTLDSMKKAKVLSSTSV